MCGPLMKKPPPVASRGFKVVKIDGSALQQTLALGLFPCQLALTADGFGFLACLADGGLLEMLLELHFAEHAFTLKFFLQSTQRLIDVVITNTYLHVVFTTSLSWICNKLQEVGI